MPWGNAKAAKLSARNASAAPKAGGRLEMEAIASCYIGGAATSGGINTIIGAVAGVFIMGILNYGMSLYGMVRRYTDNRKRCCVFRCRYGRLIVKEKERIKGSNLDENDTGAEV